MFLGTFSVVTTYAGTTRYEDYSPGLSSERCDTISKEVHVTKRFCFLFATLTAAPIAALAQGSAAAPDNPISDSEKRVYSMLSSVVIAAAEKMPEESYSFKPTPEVRSFGQLVGHLADSNYFFCSSVAGETPVGDAEKTKTKKADLVAALKDAVA